MPKRSNYSQKWVRSKFRAMVRVAVVALVATAVVGLLGNSTQATAQTSDTPAVNASIDADWISAEGFAPGSAVTFRLYTGVGGTLLWAEIHVADSNGEIYLAPGVHNRDLQAGWVIQADDGSGITQLELTAGSGTTTTTTTTDQTPNLVSSSTEDAILVEGFAPNSAITFRIYDGVGRSLRWAQNFSTDSNGEIYLAPGVHGFDLQMGWVVQATDGSVLKSLVLTPAISSTDTTDLIAEMITIVGDAEFALQTLGALDLLDQASPGWFAVVIGYLEWIMEVPEEEWIAAAWVYQGDQGTYIGSGAFYHEWYDSDDTIAHYSAVLVHEACHIRTHTQVSNYSSRDSELWSYECTVDVLKDLPKTENIDNFTKYYQHIVDTIDDESSWVWDSF